MRDPSLDLRVAVESVLSTITYAGNPVPIFDMLTDDMSNFPRIIMGQISAVGARESKCGFGSQWSQNIKISTAFPGSGRVTQNIVDEISNSILEALVPFSSPFINIGPDWQVWNVEANIPGSLTYEDKARKYIDKNIIILYTITEN